MDKNQIYTGTLPPEPPVRELHAGPVCALYQHGMLRSIRAGDIEIVRRIYAAVRDRNWNTIAGVITNESITSDESSFLVTFDMRHHRGDIDFEWHGKIKGSEDGTIEAEMQGKAHTAFYRNRIGFCVLHPIGLCAGQPCTIETTDGQFTEGSFPDLISPHQPFSDIRAIRHAAGPDCTVTVRMEGETFEMEDQRNWTDHSFKTYSTSLSLPMPVRIEVDESIDQKITLRVSGTPVETASAVSERVVDLHPQSSLHPIPALGVCLAQDEQPDPESAKRIGRLALSHLRIDICSDSAGIVSDLENAARFCALMDLQAELALHFNQSPESEAAFIFEALRATQLPVKHFLIFKKGGGITLLQTMAVVAPIIKAYAPSAQIASGTDSYFADINRTRPSSEILDSICYSVNPQVHSFDNAVVMENLEGQFETLRSAKVIAGKKGIAVTPITLRPRKNLANPAKDSGPDPRQRGLFCAAWTVGSILYCTQGDASTLTYFETTGPAGLLDQDANCVYPVYHVFASLKGFTGGTALIYKSSDSSRVVCLVLSKGVSILLLVANLTGSAQSTFIHGLPGELSCSVLDEDSFEEATRWPEQWAVKRGDTHTTSNGTLALKLKPYAVARIEAKTPR